jgi:alpha-beta hydrolase superfamily lysophospholipase
MLAPPSTLQRSKELLIGRDVIRLALRGPRLIGLPRGDGSPVILVPGFGATDASFIPLRALLTSLGHDVRSAGLGRTGDQVYELSQQVVARTREVFEETGKQVNLVGWSIGGVMAREAARDLPDVVRQVISFGSPVKGGPSYTALAWRYSPDARAAIRAEIAERNLTPITVPVTSIWSPNDGIVNPLACIDDVTPGAENIRVTGTHIGMGIDPDVWSLIAHRLATSR